MSNKLLQKLAAQIHRGHHQSWSGSLTHTQQSKTHKCQQVDWHLKGKHSVRAPSWKWFSPSALCKLASDWPTHTYTRTHQTKTLLRWKLPPSPIQQAVQTWGKSDFYIFSFMASSSWHKNTNMKLITLLTCMWDRWLASPQLCWWRRSSPGATWPRGH